MVSEEHITWTRDALSHVYNVAFLQRHAHAAGASGYGGDGSALQQALLRAIERLRPAPDTPPSSPAWRHYNILRMRYQEGLLQTEVADELHLSLRHLKREQEAAIEAVAVALFGAGDTQAPPPGDAARRDDTDHPPNSVPIQDALRNALHTLDIVLLQHNLAVTVVLQDDLPNVIADPMVARQLLMSALGWMVHDVNDADLRVNVSARARESVSVQLLKPVLAEAHAADAALAVVQQLAAETPCQVRLGALTRGDAMPTGPAAPDSPMTLLELVFDVLPARCVLVIDDDADVIQLVQRSLQGNDEFYAVGVTQPGQVLQQVAALRPSCILLDLMMPGQDGWELLRLLKTEQQSAGIPVVISSVLQEHDLALDLGADGVLTRPFTATTLAATLRGVLQAPHRG